MRYPIVERCLFLFVLFSLVVGDCLAQKPSADDAVVKISTDLIQIDVTVTDGKGKIVTGLSPSDFEIFENGEKQPISNVTFVSRLSAGATINAPGTPNVQPTSPSQIISSGKAVRTIAIVVDDLNLSFVSVTYTRKALKRFVDEQMLPGDMIAIVRTAGGIGALQQFSSDKRVLHAAIDKIRWNPSTGAFNSLLSVSQNDIDITERFNRESELIAGGGRASKQRTPITDRDQMSQKKKSEYSVASNVAASERSGYIRSSLGAVRFVLNGMKNLPGRKAMMLFSDGISIGSDSNKTGAAEVFGDLQEVADVANRSSVVVYTFDARGMNSMAIAPSDNTYEIIDGHRSQQVAVRTQDFKNSQDGLVYFASRTGGKALLNSNDFNGGIQRALDEQTGYYLIAYEPDSESFDAAKRRFNKLEVKVRRPGLNVSYRSGFFSTAGSEPETKPSVERQMAEVLISPFTKNDIALNVNALFADDASDGLYLRSFLHIDARGLTFTDQPDGWKKATFDVAAVTFSDEGLPVESKESRYTIRTKGPTYTSMLDQGFVYVLIMPLKKSGLYQYRVAVRDADTGKIGSSAQVLEIPDLGKRRLTLSSLAVEDVSLSTWQGIAAARLGAKPAQVPTASTLLYDTVLRQFRAGTVLRYGFEVYNSARAAGVPHVLETRARIFQNDRVVIEGNLNKVDVSAQSDAKRIKLSGAVMLKKELLPGDYVLQITVNDPAGGQAATQIIPFEIVE
jgi:VWFA-related protein